MTGSTDPAAGRAWLRSRWTGAAAVFLLLALVHTWPLATNPGVLSRNDNGDAQLNEWIIAWIAHQLPRRPFDLFQANIFHPAKDTLAYSEPLIVPALLAAPALWLGASPVLAHNLLVILGFVLTALAAYAVIVRWTGAHVPALVAGSLFAFNTHTLMRIAHVQALHAYGLPLALLFADRLVQQPGPRAAAGLAAAMIAMAYTSGYLAVFGAVACGVVLLARLRDWWRRPLQVAAWFAAAAAATIACVVPLALPYRRVASEQGLVRSVEAAREFSATPLGYLVTAGRVHFHTWSGRFFENPVDAFFPGVAAVLLAGVAVWAAVRRREDGSRVAMLCALAAAGAVLSLGPATPVYGWIYTVFPPMQGLRAAARFGNLFLLATALLAGLGLAALARARPHARWAARVSIAALVLVNLEALRAPFQYHRFEGIPRVYDLLAREAGPVVLAETPFYPAHAVFMNAEYVLNSTAHWKPLMNGYSGHLPPFYRDLAWTFWYFPDDQAIAAMRAAGVTHVTVHPRRFGTEASDTLARLARRADLELLAIGAGSGVRLYRFR